MAVVAVGLDLAAASTTSQQVRGLSEHQQLSAEPTFLLEFVRVGCEDFAPSAFGDSDSFKEIRNLLSECPIVDAVRCHDQPLWIVLTRAARPRHAVAPRVQWARSLQCRRFVSRPARLESSHNVHAVVRALGSPRSPSRVHIRPAPRRDDVLRTRGNPYPHSDTSSNRATSTPLLNAMPARATARPRSRLPPARSPPALLRLRLRRGRARATPRTHSRPRPQTRGRRRSHGRTRRQRARARARRRARC
ncbi:hypothetical protein B0H12DRAFT_371035 [Mycena haematopus]|nr:hypothetical protein B0H12DRAFT_371035 [Mycena haematopus]